MGKNGLRAALALSVVLSASVILNVLFLQRPPNAKVGAAPPPTAIIPTLTPRQRTGQQQASQPSTVGRAETASYRHNGKADPALVRPIQRELYSRGYTRRAPDGILDTATRAAILAWEVDHGVILSASPSERLLKAMLLGASVEPAAAAGMPPTPEAAALIRYVQGLLNEQNHGPLTATGQLDAPTRTAIMAFEKANGLAPRGRVSEAVVDKLQSRGRRG